MNAVISKSMDKIAETAFPQFDKFRQMADGYAEMVIRIANDDAKLGAILSMTKLPLRPRWFEDVADKSGPFLYNLLLRL